MKNKTPIIRKPLSFVFSLPHYLTRMFINQLFNNFIPCGNIKHHTEEYFPYRHSYPRIYHCCPPNKVQNYSQNNLMSLAGSAYRELMEFDVK